MKFKFNCIIVFFSCFFVSCIEDVQLETKHVPRLCLNCVLNPDASEIVASLSLSKNINSTEELYSVNDADIVLYEDKKLAGEFTQKDGGKYVLEFTPIHGKTYYIEVISEEYGSVYASTVIPQKPIVSYDKDTIGLDEYNLLKYDLNVKIYDNYGKNNYWIYSSGISDGMRESGGGGVVLNAPFADTFNRRFEVETKFGYVYYYHIRLTDEGFDGSVLNFTIPDLVPSNQYRAKIIISADKHYDRYLKSSILARLSEEQELPFYEPVQIYSNIENGYGVFGSYAMTVLEL